MEPKRPASLYKSRMTTFVEFKGIFYFHLNIKNVENVSQQFQIKTKRSKTLYFADQQQSGKE